MTKPIEIFSPTLVKWLTQLVSDSRISYVLLDDPINFALWYSVAEGALTLPKDAQHIVQTELNKDMTLEAMADLLERLNVFRNVQPRKMTANKAKLLLAGYALHDWVFKHRGEWNSAVKELKNTSLRFLNEETLKLYGQRYPMYSAVASLADALKVTPLQRELIEFSFFAPMLDELQELLGRVQEGLYEERLLWPALFDTTGDHLREALKSDSALRMSGLLQESSHGSVSVSPYWINCFTQAVVDRREEVLLKDILIEPMVYKAGTGAPAILLDQDRQLAVSLLQAKEEPCVNILLYGPRSLDRSDVIRDLAAQSKRQAYRIVDLDAMSYSERRTAVFLAMHVMATIDHGLLVIDRLQGVLDDRQSSMFLKLFGIEVEDEFSPLNEYLLSKFKHPTVWVSTDPKTLQDEVLARFMAHIPLKKADKLQRQAHFEKTIERLRITKGLKEKLIKLDGVSAIQVNLAVQAAKISQPSSPKERDQWIYQSVKRGLRAMGRDRDTPMKESITQYSLEYVNSAGRFGPTQILKALEKSRKGTMVLYGPPGTGKTQFVEYMASTLGIPLVSKRASDLLSKWLGDQEKNIAAMFEEASSEDSMLLLDEGDSFLRDRTNARASWEVTGVNELLQHMERFDGIFVVCTNLFQGLDAAAMRRFTFKLEFLPLTPEQKWEMFVNETGLRGQLSKVSTSEREQWFDRLIFMTQLCAGDFATVKRQCSILQVQLTPKEWLDQLELECKLKKSSTYTPEMD